MLILLGLTRIPFTYHIAIDAQISRPALNLAHLQLSKRVENCCSENVETNVSLKKKKGLHR